MDQQLQGYDGKNKKDLWVTLTLGLKELFPIFTAVR
jgi:hypothetical protein